MFAFLGLTVCPAAAMTRWTSHEKTAISGKEVSVLKGSSLNPDCSTEGRQDLRAIAGPSHGKIRIVFGKIYPVYSKGSDRYKCDSRKVDGVSGLYRSNPGFKGRDQITFSVHTIMGESYTVVINITVK
jgi:hypothetical protein